MQGMWISWKNLAAVTLLLMGLGCEKDEAAPLLGAGHDFGESDPTVLVCLGDSLTTGSGLSTDEAYPHQLALMTGLTVHNEGRDKELSQGGVHRVAGVLRRHRPGYLILLYGTNDVLFDKPAAGVISALTQMIQAARSEQTVPLLITLPPQAARQMVVDAVNAELRQLARVENVALVDMAEELRDGAGFLQPDGVHLNASGAQRLARACANRL